MKKPAFIKHDNPVRAWSRRAVRGIRSRPDVQVAQLQRKIEVLERLIGVEGRALPWTDDFVSFLTPRQYPSLPLARIGSPHDGGYVLPIGLVRSAAGVVSIGVGDNNAADVDLAKMGLSVHAWDHTVTSLPTKHENLTFHHAGLGVPSTSAALQALDSITDASFGASQGGLVLMMDAEGAEWDALGSCQDRTLDRFSVVSIELHDLGDLLVDPAPQLAVLERMATHFAVLCVHPNNHGAVWSLPELELWDALEVTYVSRGLLSEPGQPGNGPVGLLAACCPDLPDPQLTWVPAG